jgi:hypothetical protein
LTKVTCIRQYGNASAGAHYFPREEFPVKKLSLNVDELHVDSFATAPGDPTLRGTIKALGFTDYCTHPDDQVTRGYTCLGTCPMAPTCNYGNSCNGTCYETCVSSCVGVSCFESCDGTCYGETCGC